MILFYRIAVLSRPLDFLSISTNHIRAHLLTQKIESWNFEQSYFFRKKKSAQSFVNPKKITWTLSGFGLADCFRCSSIFFSRAICCLSERGTIRPDGATKERLLKTQIFFPNFYIFPRSFFVSCRSLPDIGSASDMSQKSVKISRKLYFHHI